MKDPRPPFYQVPTKSGYWGMCQVLVIVSFLLASCTTKSKADLQARKAFLAGQQQALMSMQQPQQPTVRMLGPVKLQFIPWSEGLTLAKAVITAEYTGNGTPRVILVVRNGRAVSVDPNQLLKGEDVPLEAGDIVDIRQ